jgi:hypothetical protein
MFSAKKNFLIAQNVMEEDFVIRDNITFKDNDPIWNKMIEREDQQRPWTKETFQRVL